LTIPVLALAQAAVIAAVVVGVATKKPGDAEAATAPRSLAASTSRPAAAVRSHSPASNASASRGVAVEAASELGRSFIIPVAGVVSSALHDGFAERRSGGRTHEALDIMAPRGTPVLSAADGRLLRLHTSKAGGLMVYAADTSDQLILMYAHLDSYATGLVEGALLRKGQLLGYVGTTGNAPPNAPHLHFAVARGQPSVSWWKGVAVNPYPLLMNASPSYAPAIQLATSVDTSTGSHGDTPVKSRSGGHRQFYAHPYPLR
jgi:murein DD-endopeptidase MepM/ murein hydrolase activator NlpD